MEKTEKKPKSTLKHNWKTSVFVYSLIFWPLVHFAIFYVYMNIDTVAMTFQGFSVREMDYVPVGFKNYIDIYKWLFLDNPNDNLRYALGNGISIVLFQDFVMIPISLFFGYICYKKVPWGGFFKVVFFLPNIVSIVVLAMVFKLAFDPNLGVIQPLLNALGLGHITPEHGWFASDSTAWGMNLLYCLWAGIGYNMILFIGGFNRVPLELSESAQLDGAGFFREFFSISIPLVSTTVATLVTLATSSVLTFYIQPMMLTNGGPLGHTYTIMYIIFERVKTGKTGLNIAATIGVAFSLVFVPIVYGIKRLMEHLFPAVEY